jgi:hypothetical protein
MTLLSSKIKLNKNKEKKEEEWLCSDFGEVCVKLYFGCSGFLSVVDFLNVV